MEKINTDYRDTTVNCSRCTNREPASLISENKYKVSI